MAKFQSSPERAFNSSMESSMDPWHLISRASCPFGSPFEKIEHGSFNEEIHICVNKGLV